MSVEEAQMGLCRWAYSEMGSYAEDKNPHRFAMCFQVETSIMVGSSTFQNIFRNYKFKFNINFQSHISVFISERQNGKCKIKIKKKLTDSPGTPTGPAGPLSPGAPGGPSEPRSPGNPRSPWRSEEKKDK